MRNPSLHLFYHGVMHVIIVACPHPHLSCCIYTALIPCLAAYKYTALIPCVAVYSTRFSTFWHCHPYILQHFSRNVFTLLYEKDISGGARQAMSNPWTALF